MDRIKNTLSLIQEQLKRSACKLVVVSKNQSVENIQCVYDTGHRWFGENKVQELIAKKDKLPADIQWHFIGHLQRNKVKYIAPFISLIHSVDTIPLLHEINKQGSHTGRIIPCLLQVHIATEKNKFGWNRDELLSMCTSGFLETLSWVQIVGLMGMASLTHHEQQIRDEFKRLHALYISLKEQARKNIVMNELSMGMSNDYPIALQEGSTIVRIGSAIFEN